MDQLMARPRKASGLKTNATDLHRAWLQLVDTDGPFLAIPPLKRVWPNGIPDFRATHADSFDALVEGRKAFEAAWEALDRDPDSETRLSGYRTERDKWVETVLRDVVGWGESLEWGVVPGVEAHSPNRAVKVTAQGALLGAEGVGALVLVVDPTESLRQTPSDLWAANPVDRCEALLRENSVEIGIVTDGRWWGLVCAREGSMAASGIVDALTWVEEPRTRDAFLTVVGRQRIIGGDPAERLPMLFKESVAAAEEITEALGAQVRRAVELLIQSFSESAAEAERRGLPDPLPDRSHDTYEAAVTVMMRTVFLLFAEERSLLPAGELFEQGYGIAGELDRLTARKDDESEEALDATSLTWHRLLATSQALYRGASFENLRMPAYGGSLFDPTRFPFLTDTNEQGALAVTVSDRVMLHVLRSVQKAEVKGESRRISFRDIDVEQIGYIYEGLLGYTASRADEPTLGLIGAVGAEPEIPLATLEELAAKNADHADLAAAVREWVEKDQPSASPSSSAAIAKAITAAADPSAISALTQIVGEDDTLRDRVKPWLGLVRADLRGHPFVVLAGGLVVKETPSRKNAGAHYTPKSLAEEIVLHALQPLCYSPGPHQTADSGQWKLKSSDELLGLKVADIACGSGAFLVAAARYLADRVVEAWTREDPANSLRKDLYLRAIRQVVANCLYGADINDMAVEMCKLSLWLVSLDRDLPFSFVDDKVFLGNSLLGLTRLDQIRKLHVDPQRVQSSEMFDIFNVDIDTIIRRAVALRERLSTEIDEDDPARSSAAKHRQLRELHEITSALRKIADGVIAAGLTVESKTGTTSGTGYENLREAVKKAYPGSPDRDSDATWLNAIIDHGLTPTVPTDYERWRPLHWILEAPDVMVLHGGFDAIIGNPAFLHSKKITTAYGKNYRDYLRTTLAAGAAGNADLAAYFLLRQAKLIRNIGDIGIVVTKSILQSHTKIVGLDQVLSSGGSIVQSSKPFDWGPRGASVSVVKLWITRSKILGGKNLAGEPKTPSGALPVPAYVGTYPNGDGFRVSAGRAQTWISDSPRLKEHLFPYIRAADLSQGTPALPTEYLIDIDGLGESEARNTGPLWAHLEENQKPWRSRPQKDEKLRERWWDFERSADALYRELAAIDRAIAIPRTSNLLMPRWIPTNTRVDMGVVVFPINNWCVYAQIASSMHYHWVISYGATTRDDPSYAPRRLSNTFPWITKEGDGDAAMRFEAALEKLCRKYGGLRPVMNAFNDSANHSNDLRQLRELYVELDAEVLTLFGWSDIQPTYGFHERQNLMRFTVDPEARDEMLYRLLEENGRRSAAQLSAAPKTSARKTKSKAQQEEALFS